MLRQSGGSILGNEARQNSKLREALNLGFFNGMSPYPSLTWISDRRVVPTRAGPAWSGG